MVYGLGMMYQLLDEYAENDIDEIEHAFTYGLKWPDSYVLKISDQRFWVKVQECYDILLTDDDKRKIVTVGSLKEVICAGEILGNLWL